jgi:hypothetical protein
MRKLPVILKPIQVRGSLYILLPKTITQLFNINTDTTFVLSIEERENELLLMFRTKRPNNGPRSLGRKVKNSG